ncbi:hypothetical protein PanNE5_29530 [Pandoraea sp. NE5]|uniref:LexA family transcriptional regulator n=1 Tax=Pandoraea sp. NE5 TaxID=2904129 RepID=UPI0021C48A07|nr:LexA family transcriptional regulator [Pandoraea sp. NE5]BDD93513.1 hypothetical protein PanNE5_29530 [Pandoraea sp. NE5]
MRTIDEIRRTNLLLAIERLGSAKKLADATGLAPAYISQVKTRAPESKGGKQRNLGDDAARRIDKALGEPTGWMDTPHGITRCADALADRIAKVFSESNVTLEELDAAAGAPHGTASKWLSGHVSEIPHVQAARIQEAYGFNMVWLVTGQGEERIPSYRRPDQKVVPVTPKLLDESAPEGFPARLQHAMNLRNVRLKADVAKAAGVSASAVSQWFRGDTKSLKAGSILALAKFLRVQVDWLKDGTGPMEGDANVRAAEIGMRRIPLISSVQAGLMHEAVTPFPPGSAFEYLLTDLDLSESAFALEVEGRSMEPEFKEGDRVIVDPAIKPIPGDFVVAKNGHEEATFKKYRPRGIDENGVEVFELVPLNPDYPTINSAREPAHVIAVMVEHRRYRRR